MDKNFAICIGINAYEYTNHLHYAVRDAKAMRDFLEEEAGFNKVYYFSDDSPSINDPDCSVSFPSDPLLNRLEFFLYHRFEQPFLSERDNLWFFFSGHGIRYEDRDYLMPRDADPNRVKRTSLSLQEVVERLRRSGAGNVMLLLDACRGQGSKGQGMGKQSHQGIITIASCSPSENAYEIEQLEHGSFTYALLQGLRDEQGRNCATVEKFANYLKHKISQLNRNHQKPHQTPYVAYEPPSKKYCIILPNKGIESIYLEPLDIESCYNEILTPGCLLRIKAPWKMGKTSLMSRILNHAASQGCRTVVVNLRDTTETDFNNLELFLKWFCTQITTQLMADTIGNDPVNEHWHKSIGNSKNRCKTYFEKELLNHSAPLVLAIDELDRIFPYQEIAGDFLGWLRTRHEDAKTRPVWRNLRQVVIYTEHYMNININMSPFNVPTGIKLKDLSQEQIENLVERYGQVNCWNSTQVQKLMDMVGGHPYFIHEAIKQVKQQNLPLDDILKEAPTNNGIYAEHLQRLWQKVKQEPALMINLQKVVIAEVPVKLNPEQADRLDNLGLVRLQSNGVVPRYELYRQYFQRYLGSNNK